MTAEHNHSPRCCCEPQTDTITPPAECPACPEHGQLATVECTQCHQPASRPHTDYCPTGRILAAASTPVVVYFENDIADNDRPYLAEQAGRAARGQAHDPGPWCQRFNCTTHLRRNSR